MSKFSNFATPHTVQFVSRNTALLDSTRKYHTKAIKSCSPVHCFSFPEVFVPLVKV